jgi:hypothetical protein
LGAVVLSPSIPGFEGRFVASLNLGLDDLQRRAIASGACAVADYDHPWGYTRELHPQTRACKKALFFGVFSKLL